LITLKLCLLRQRRAALLLLLALSLFMGALVWIPLPEGKLHPPQAYRFYDRHEQLIARLISSDGFFRMHIPFDKISPLFIRALLLHEDQYFYTHPGVNPLAIIRATTQNLLHGRIVSGGSTLTMQLARMLDRQPRTCSAKFIEAFRAFQLEWRYSKDEILAYYLALAPYGGNLEGIQAASFAYYGKPAQSLSISETALLIALPKSPNRLRPDLHPEAARMERKAVLTRLRDGRLINEDQYQRAVLEPIPGRRRVENNLIPHTAWHYRLKQPERYVWFTTIDENMQRQTLRLLQAHVSRLLGYNITNAAAVVIDNRSGEVRAAVGSLDYFSKKNLGANDGCRAARSPGSTLKPFLYGLAMQRGLVSEKTMLYDIPVNYGGYAPQNYNRDYAGPVTMREALTDSLNIPAVRLSAQLGVDQLHHLLRDGGVSTLDHSPDYYGLPLVLGGVEVQLIELTNLYAALAHGGVYRPYRLIRQQREVRKSRRILSEEASWLISHILLDVRRPDFPESWQFSKNRPAVAWKTGTSYDHRDAWSVGYTPELTIGVWLGNFNGSPSNGLVGNQAAAPVLFDLIQTLQSPGVDWFRKPEAVKKRQVCAVCGTLANQYCKQHVEEYVISNIDGPVQHDVCQIPQMILVDQRNGQQANSDTPAKYAVKKVYNVWPSEVAAQLLKSGRPVREVPPYNIRQMAGQKYYPPVILSPVRHTEYYQRPDRFELQRHGIMLDVAVTNRIRKVFWFLDEQLIAEGDPIKPVFVNPPPGRHRLRVMDEVGGSDELDLIIKDYRELADAVTTHGSGATD